MTRLRKIASIEDLSEMNMPQDLINQILYQQGEDVTAEDVLYRRLMNQNTKFIVEMWSTSDKTFRVFSGSYNGMWTPGDIENHGIFDNESAAESYIQENLQGQAEYGEAVMVGSRLKRNNFKTLHAAGNEPDYKEIADGFASHIDIKIPDVEKGHKTSLNKYYDDFASYMTKYYPDWARYPAFIWGGWGYFTDNFGKDEEPKEEEPKEEEVKEEPQQEQAQPEVQPAMDTNTVDMGSDIGSDMGSDSSF